MYIPKSQIKDNLFTPGGEWFYVSNNSPYTGFYYQLANGKAYTGKDQNTPPNEEIYEYTISEPYIPGEVQPDIVQFNDLWDTNDLQIYGRLKSTDYGLLRAIPPLTKTIPTSEDYENYTFKRYFVVKVNEIVYTEISLEVYNQINSQNPVWMWENYIPFTLTWTLKGNIDSVFKSNNGMIFLAEKDIKRKGLDIYLNKNYLQYYLYPKKENLFTDGGLLLDIAGNNYIGSYHVHETQGPMVGAMHTNTNHNRLFYKRFYRTEIINSQNQTNIVVTEETQNQEYRSALSPSNRGGSSSGGGY